LAEIPHAASAKTSTVSLRGLFGGRPLNINDASADRQQRPGRHLFDTRGDSLTARADPLQHSSRCEGRRFGLRQLEMVV
jgi:hypothetical protein